MTSDSLSFAENVPETETKRSAGVDARVDPRLLELLVCPLTKGELVYDAVAQTLTSSKARLVYPIRDGIPILLPEEATRF
jgi:uncharacterized protein